MTDLIIGPFSGEYRWLSNFWQEPARKMLTNEHFYQAEKTLIPRERAQIMLAHSAGAAKRLGAIATLRPDWNEIRVSVMLSHLRNKFYLDASLTSRLLATGDAKLEEINHWGDQFWGVSGGGGKNNLGLLLMQVRDEVKGLVELSA